VAIGQLSGGGAGDRTSVAAVPYPKASRDRPAYEAFTPTAAGGDPDYEVSAPPGMVTAGGRNVEMYAIPASQQQTAGSMRKVQSIDIAPPPPSRTHVTEARVESEVYEVPASLVGTGEGAELKSSSSEYGRGARSDTFVSRQLPAGTLADRLGGDVIASAHASLARGESRGAGAPGITRPLPVRGTAALLIVIVVCVYHHSCGSLAH
jgi:hypothetical protein